MHNVVITGPGSVEVREAPDPVPPGLDGAVVAVDAAGICTSTTATSRWGTVSPSVTNSSAP
jgi:threonine dehydrogenase-like Zn-dependent dehydrogenase